VRRFLIPVILLSFSLAASAQDNREARLRMVSTQIADRGITSSAVLEAMRSVERHLFVPEDVRSFAYDDQPLPIGEGQTISQPYIVALMTESLGLKRTDRVLEIGTGSGYQAAVLSRLVREIFTIEIKEPLFTRARAILSSIGARNVTTRLGDGYYGWPEKAPFDCIMITAAVNHIPPPLLAQLKDGGRLILPLGNPFGYQNLVLVTRRGGTYTTDSILGVLFVPMTGKAAEGAR
jgi:protein-L-isoaspartate(D-aspartate) O-methyltransferase